MTSNEKLVSRKPQLYLVCLDALALFLFSKGNVILLKVGYKSDETVTVNWTIPARVQRLCHTSLTTLTTTLTNKP